MSFVSQKSYLHGNANSFLHDRKFDTAIRKSTIDKFIKDKDNPSFADRLIWHHHPQAQSYLKDTTLLPRLMLDLLTGSITTRYQQKIDHQRLFDILTNVMQLQLSYLKSSTNLRNLSHINRQWTQIIKDLSNRLEVIRLIHAIVDLDEIIELLPGINQYYPEDVMEDDRLIRKTSCNTAKVQTLNLEATWSYQMIVLKYGCNSWILPRPFLLQIKAKFADLLSVLIYSHLSAHGPNDGNAYEITLRFVCEYCRLHIKRPENFFTLAASLEGLMVAQILRKTETWVNDDLWRLLCKEVNEALEINLEVEPIYHVFKDCSVPQLAELSCLSKIVGHPLVDMVEGARKLYNRVTKDFNVSISAIASCINHIKENYVLNFIARYNRWPSVSFTKLAHPLLKESRNQNVSPRTERLVLKYGNIKLVDWSSVRIEKEMTFDYCENRLSLLADKAISVTRSSTLTTYLLNKNPSRKETRLLLFYLFTDGDASDHIKYLDQYVKCEGEFDILLDYMVIRLVPKEKELKTLFRGFGCTTANERARRIVQGRNAMNYLHQFSDEQALTLDELSLVKKIHSFLRLREMYKDHRIFYINFDASGWNNMFRDKTVGPVVRETIDPAYGVKIWRWTHKSYENILVIIPDAEQCIWWTGQLGGIEGLDQPTWQLVYSGQIKTAFEGTNYAYHLLNKGDDMRAAVPIPVAVINPDEAGNVAKGLRDNVCQAAKNFGHEIKAQESYVSERLFTFSKSMYLDEVPLPYVYRKIQKTHGESNSFMPFLDDYVASAYSNGHSASGNSTVHVPQFIISTFWVISFLLRHPVFAHCSNHEYGALCCIPSTVGGLPIIYLHNFLVRAESDLLSSFISLYKFTERLQHPYYTIFKNYLEIPCDMNASKAMLLNDPYCLPLFRPKLPIAKLKTLVQRKLYHSNIKTEVKELISILEPKYINDLIIVLSSGKYWWAKLYSALYDATPMAQAEKFLSQFLSAKSVLDAFLVTRTSRRRSEKLLSDCAKQDVVVNVWRFNTLRGLMSKENRDQILSKDCPTEIAQELRDTMWKIPILTVTHPAVPHQIFVTDESYSLISPRSIQEHFTLTFDQSPKDPMNMNNCHFTKGQYLPFFGHKTTPGTVVPTVKVMENDPVCGSILDLIMLYNYTNCVALEDDNLITSNFPQLVSKVLKSLTSMDISQLSPFTATKKSGTQTHRLRSRGFKASIVPNSNSVPYSKVMGETNTHRLFRESIEDYTVNFLHLFCYGTIISQFDSQAQKTTECPPRVWLVTQPCNFCLKPIKEPLIRLNESLIATYSPPYISMTRVGQSAEPILSNALATFHEKHPEVRNIDHDYTDVEKSQRTLAWYWISSVWGREMRVSTRYRMFRRTSNQVEIAHELLGAKETISIGETEIRLIPMSILFEVLSIHVTSYMISMRMCHTLLDVTGDMSTIHVEGCPWFHIISKLSGYGLLQPFISVAQESLQDVAPITVSHDLSACMKYITPILFQYCLEVILARDEITIPFINEKGVEYHYSMMKPLCSLARYSAALQLKSRIEREDDPNTFLHCYFSVVAPPIDLPTHIENISGGRYDTIELISRATFDVSKDFIAIQDDHHMSYFMLQWAVGSQKPELMNVLRSMTSEQIEDCYDEMDTKLLSIAPYDISLSSAIDHVRAARRGAMDYEEGDLRMERDVMPIKPNFKLPKRFITSLAQLTTFNKIEGPGSVPTTIPPVQVVNNVAYGFQLHGSDRLVSSVIAQLISLLGISRDNLKSVKNILVLNDHMYGGTYSVIHACPTSNVAVHMPVSHTSAIPILTKSGSLPAEYETHKVLLGTMRAGMTDLTLWETWVALLDEVTSYPELILMRLRPNRTYDQWMREYKNLIMVLNNKEINNTLIIVESSMDILNRIGGFLSALQFVMFQVHLIRLPTDPIKGRIWVIGYGLNLTDITVAVNLTHRPHPMTRQAIVNFQSSMVAVNASWGTATSDNLAIVETILQRTQAYFPGIDTNLRSVVCKKLVLTQILLTNTESHTAVLTSLRVTMASELMKKEQVFPLQNPEQSINMPADKTLRHKIQVLVRIITLKYAIYMIDYLNQIKFNAHIAFLEFPSYESFVRDNLSSSVYWGQWLSEDGKFIRRGAYNHPLQEFITRVDQAFYNILGHFYLLMKVHLLD